MSNNTDNSLEKDSMGNFKDMYDEEIIRANDKKIEPIGFYYDNQMSNPFLTMTLHPSTYQVDESTTSKEGVTTTKKVWKPYQEGFDPLIPSNGPEKKEEKFKYSKNPIAVALLTEDPSFTVGNTFTDWNGGNPIEGIFGSAKPYAVIGKEWVKGLAEGAKSMKGENNFGASIVKAAGDVAGFVGKALDAGSKLLNKGLVVQGTRFTYYNGTNFSMNNLEFKFIKFSDYVKKGNDWVFQDVLEYMRTDLFPYCFGTYAKASESGLEISSNKDVQNFIDKYCGFQSAPGGFEMNAKNLDTAIIGTLRLNIGGTYALENLVIKNLNFTLSKAQAKKPNKDSNGRGETVPLYAEISLTLSPACMITDHSFNKIIDPKMNGLLGFRGAKITQYSNLLNELLKKRQDAFSDARKKITSGKIVFGGDSPRVAQKRSGLI